jgi:hypothetical protein
MTSMARVRTWRPERWLRSAIRIPGRSGSSRGEPSFSVLRDAIQALSLHRKLVDYRSGIAEPNGRSDQALY